MQENGPTAEPSEPGADAKADAKGKAKIPPSPVEKIRSASDDLPGLTARQYRFVELVLGGASATDAYRGAYDVSRISERALWVQAARTAHSPNVRLWIAEARKAQLGTAIITAGTHLAQLERLREIALDSGNVSAAVAAEQARGKVAGLYRDDVTVTVQKVDPSPDIEWIARRYGADVARAIAEREGIPFRMIEASPAPSEQQKVSDADVVDSVNALDTQTEVAP